VTVAGRGGRGGPGSDFLDRGQTFFLFFLSVVLVPAFVGSLSRFWCSWRLGRDGGAGGGGLRLHLPHDRCQLTRQTGRVLQAGLQTPRQVRYAGGAREAQPHRQFAERRFAVPAAKPGGNGPGMRNRDAARIADGRNAGENKLRLPPFRVPTASRFSFITGAVGRIVSHPDRFSPGSPFGRGRPGVAGWRQRRMFGAGRETGGRLAPNPENPRPGAKSLSLAQVRYPIPSHARGGPWRGRSGRGAPSKPLESSGSTRDCRTMGKIACFFASIWPFRQDYIYEAFASRKTFLGWPEMGFCQKSRNHGCPLRTRTLRLTTRRASK
jgi:hypothetical protein